ncbi:hypothetical protein LWI29_001783 [Acer saccharum]|uniref:BED-type domain-containing protein n=1 Tax=Acer saccharum TaxID=4024 RepID=A0AA39T3U7_ACESA|nr:hypothetical protein LWI29_001783 [Acer saccharum]
MPRSLSRSPSYRRRYSPPPVAHRHSRRSKREGSRSRSRSPFSNSHSRRRSHSNSPRRRRNRSPSYRRRKSRSPTPRKHNKRQGSSSRSLSPVSKSSGPSSTSSERKNAIEKLKKEEEEKKRLVCKMSNRKDPAWKYGVEVETDGGKAYKYIRCTFCKKIIKGGVFRMKQHLAGIRRNVAPCTRVSDEVRDEIKSYMTKNDTAKNTAQLINFTSQTKGGSSSGSVSQLRIGGPMDRFVTNIDEDKAELRGNNKQGSEEEAGSKEEARDRTSMDIAKFFFENGIAFNVASSPSFINMCRSVGNYGRGLKPPTSCELSTTILKEEESNTQAIVAEVKKTWTQTGVSIIFDGWKDMRGRHLINLLVNNPHGTIFLSWAKKVDGKEIKKIILRDQAFWGSMSYALKTTEPLVSVLRMTALEKMPAMGFIYGAMDKAKEEIAKNLGDKEGAYKEIWKIIDDKWEFQSQRHLHAAAYFLNPRFQYSENLSTHPISEIKLGLFTCLLKLIPNEPERVKAHLQIHNFKDKRGMFSFGQAKTLIYDRSPADWWIQYGDETPELTSFAVRVLSLTCSSLACERNWNTFNTIHTKKRNRLATTKLSSLVYIMYNKKLQHKFLRKQGRKDDEDPLVSDVLPSDDEWVVEEDSSGQKSTNGLSGVIDDIPESVDMSQHSGNRQVGQKRKRNTNKGKAMQAVDEKPEWEDIPSDTEDDKEETARRLEEAIRRNVEQRLNSEEAKLEVVRRIEEGREKLFNDIVTKLEKEKEAALMEARQKEEQARREREELDKMLEENKRRVEEAQRREALEQQRKEEERHRELELIQRQKEEAARRKKLEEEEEQRANQMKSSGKNKNWSKTPFGHGI